MEFWLTDGILHKARTRVYSMYGTFVPCYEDAGQQVTIPDDAETIIIPEGTVEIGQNAFRVDNYPKTKGGNRTRWPNVKKVVLPDSVKRIADNAFHGLKMSEINLPDGLKSIGLYAFAETNLESIMLPESIEYIGDYCFYFCSELRTIVFPKSFVFRPNWSEMAPFIALSAHAKEHYPKDCFKMCRRLESISIREAPENCLILWGCHSIKCIVIPEGVTKLIHSQYKDCRSLEKIIIPETVKEIGESTFEGCVSLSSIVIPASAQRIAQSAFRGCTGLRTITLKTAFQGFETAFPNTKDIEKVFISGDVMWRAKIVFPKAEIYNLNGKLLYAPDENETKAEDGSSTDAMVINTPCPAVNGELIPGSGLSRFRNHEFDIDNGDHRFHVKLKGFLTANRICKAYYSNASIEAEPELYDAEALMKANPELYFIEPHSGILTETLSDEHERSYSAILNVGEIVEYVTRFSRGLERCLTESSVEKILRYVPRKENGTLYKNRTTMILKSRLADADGYSLVLIANNATDTELILEIRRMYIGREKYNDAEAARVIGFV